MEPSLLLGDCLEKMKEIPDNSIDLILTDPPYGTTSCKWDSVIPFKPMWQNIWRVLKPNGVCALFCSQPFTSALGASQIEYLRYAWVWEKHHATGHLNARKRPMKLTEDVLIFYKKTPLYNPQGITEVNKIVSNSDSHCRRGGQNKTSTVSGGLQKLYIQHATGYPRNLIKFKSCNSNKFHPTQKPVDLLEYLVKTYTNTDETVLDFAMGSGSTGIACLNSNRRFVGIEIDETYFSTASKLIESLHIIN